MKKIYKGIISLLLSFMIISTSVNVAFAVDYDMSYSEGGGGGNTSAASQYSVNDLGDAVAAGYRFSLVNSTGLRVSGSSVIDVYREGYAGHSTAWGSYKLFKKGTTNTKFNKAQWNNVITNSKESSYYGRFSTSTTNSKKDGDLSITLPASPSSLKSYIKGNNTRIKNIINAVGVTNLDDRPASDFLDYNGYIILCEPLFLLKININNSYNWATMTISDIGMYGRYMFGGSSGTTTSSNTGAWGYISEYTNKVWPFSLKTSSGSNFSNDDYNWNGTASTQTFLTFNQMITRGYGIGIAAGEMSDEPVAEDIGLEIKNAMFGKISNNQYVSGTPKSIKRVNSDGNSSTTNKSNSMYWETYNQDSVKGAVILSNNSSTKTINLSDIDITYTFYFDETTDKNSRDGSSLKTDHVFKTTVAANSSKIKRFRVSSANAQNYMTWGTVATSSTLGPGDIMLFVYDDTAFKTYDCRNSSCDLVLSEDSILTIRATVSLSESWNNITSGTTKIYSNYGLDLGNRGLTLQTVALGYWDSSSVLHRVTPYISGRGAASASINYNINPANPTVLQEKGPQTAFTSVMALTTSAKDNRNNAKIPLSDISIYYYHGYDNSTDSANKYDVEVTRTYLPTLYSSGKFKIYISNSVDTGYTTTYDNSKVVTDIANTYLTSGQTLIMAYSGGNWMYTANVGGLLYDPSNTHLSAYYHLGTNKYTNTNSDNAAMQSRNRVGILQPTITAGIGNANSTTMLSMDISNNSKRLEEGKSYSPIVYYKNNSSFSYKLSKIELYNNFTNETAVWNYTNYYIPANASFSKYGVNLSKTDDVLKSSENKEKFTLNYNSLSSVRKKDYCYNAVENDPSAYIVITGTVTDNSKTVNGTVSDNEYAVFNIKSPTTGSNVYSDYRDNKSFSLIESQISDMKLYSGQPIALNYTLRNNSSFLSYFDWTNQVLEGVLNPIFKIKNLNKKVIDNFTVSSKYHGYNPYNVNVDFSNTTLLRLNNKATPYFYSYASYSGSANKYNLPTMQNDTHYTVYPSDVEALTPEIFDAADYDAGNRVPLREFYYGQEVYIIYQYKNNSNLAVRAIQEGYNENNPTSDFHYDSIIMEANSTDTIKVKTTIDLPEDSYKTFNITSKIYLYGHLDDTYYENNKDNNIAVNKVDGIIYSPLKIKFIEPNATYREGVEVISSYTVENTSFYDITNESNDRSVKSKLEVYEGNVSKEEIYGGTIEPIATATSTFDIPKKETSMFWFNWVVPENINEDTLTLVAYADGGILFVDTEVYNNPLEEENQMDVSTWGVEKNITVQTPDTTYTPSKPYWFNGVTEIDTSKTIYDQNLIDTTSWSIWEYGISTGFKKNTYSVSLNNNVEIVPDGSPTAFINDDDLYQMKSGYGYNLTLTTSLGGSGRNMTTGLQNAYTMFPEFNNTTAVNSIVDAVGNDVSFYLESGSGKTRTGFKKIEKDSSGNYVKDEDNDGYYGTFASLDVLSENYAQLPINNTTKTNTHFIPIWFPNSKYSVITAIYDVWTPSGMLGQYTQSNSIQIEGNMYDDYYIKPGK